MANEHRNIEHELITLGPRVKIDVAHGPTYDQVPNCWLIFHVYVRLAEVTNM